MRVAARRNKVERMSYRDTVADLFRHQTWADAAMWTAVMASPAAMIDAAIQDRLVHIHLVQRVYLQGWEAREFDPAIPPFADAASRMRWGYEYHQAVTPFIEALDADRLDDAFPLPWAEIVEQSLGRPSAPGDTGRDAAAGSDAQHLSPWPDCHPHARTGRRTGRHRLHPVGVLGKPAASWPA